MSRTKRRTDNIDRYTYIYKAFWGEHLMFDYRGRPRYESVQAMYDAEMAERDRNIRRYHTDNFKSYYIHSKIKECVRLSGARSAVRQGLRKAVIRNEFDDLHFNHEDVINCRALWWG